MTKWEHISRTLLVRSSRGIIVTRLPTVDGRETLVELEKIGDHGWEMIGLCETGFHGHIGIFKRPVQEVKP